MEEVMIKVDHVSKEFGKIRVVSDVSFTVEKGEIMGLVGRNGSGKSVLLKMISGLFSISTGKILVNGKEVGKDTEIPESMGILIERPGFYESFSARKNISYMQALSGIHDANRVDEVIRMVGLDPESKKAVGKYSMGMKQRLGIAQAILEDPELLILDEPTSGLDASGVDQIREMLLALNQQGKTIILSSHYKEDIEKLCNHIVELDQGSIRKEWRREELESDEKNMDHD